MKSIISWDVTPCSLLRCNQRFGGTYCLHPQGRRKFQEVSRWQLAGSCTSWASWTRYHDPGTWRQVYEDDIGIRVSRGRHVLCRSSGPVHRFRNGTVRPLKRLCRIRSSFLHRVPPWSRVRLIPQLDTARAIGLVSVAQLRPWLITGTTFGFTGHERTDCDHKHCFYSMVTTLRFQFHGSHFTALCIESLVNNVSWCKSPGVCTRLLPQSASVA
jgi:hypothetical protein